MARPAVFWDRDGVLNENVKRDGICSSPRFLDQFKPRCGMPDILVASRNSGFLNIVVTNQPDVARGFMAMYEAEKMRQACFNVFAIDDYYACYHDDSDNCDCRKPKPGMIKKAAAKYGINLNKSVIIGDRDKDILCGIAAGIKTVYLKYNNVPLVGVTPDFDATTNHDLINILKELT